jgi:hypothetical protein
LCVAAEEADRADKERRSARRTPALLILQQTLSATLTRAADSEPPEAEQRRGLGGRFRAL